MIRWEEERDEMKWIDTLQVAGAGIDAFMCEWCNSYVIRLVMLMEKRHWPQSEMEKCGELHNNERMMKDGEAALAMSLSSHELVTRMEKKEASCLLVH